MSDLSWRWVSASVTGTSHTVSGMECQDSHFCNEIQTPEGPVLLTFVSDGAGSAAKSAIGSRLVCDVLFDKSLEFFRDDGRVSQLTLRLIANWIQFFRDEVILQAAADGLSDRDYACTLLGAIVAEKAAALFQVGDGAIVYTTQPNEQTPTLAFWPERGEYENTTFFITQSTFLDQMQFCLIPERIFELALLSDGLQRIALNYQTKTAHAPFFSGLFAPLRMTPKRDALALSTKLAEYLDSPKVNDRTDDDKTLILATSLDSEFLTEKRMDVSGTR